MAKKRIPHSVDNAEIEKNASGTPRYVFAITLNRLMEEQCIDQEKMAADLGLSTGIISNYRNGKTEPKLSAITKISEYLNVDCDFLMRGISSKNTSIAKATGLSNKAIENLKLVTGWTESGPSTLQPVLSDLIANQGFELLLNSLESFKEYVVLYKSSHDNVCNELSKIGASIPISDLELLKIAREYIEMDSLKAISENICDVRDAAKVFMDRDDKKSYFQYKTQLAVQAICEKYEQKILNK